MATVTRNVNDLEPGDQRALEHVIGIPLSENQQIVIQVLETNVGEDKALEYDEPGAESGRLPDWCDVYEGLSDEEIADIERCIVRCGNGRSFH